jgi:putative FmdB family regulatory protein
MPTYIYQCACGQKEEVVHSMNEDPLIECMKCRIPMTRKPQFNSYALKGKGFYSKGG